MLPGDVEHTCPDYGLYRLDYSIGFLTRGCARKCKHCFVPRKEGAIRSHAEIGEFLRHRSAVLLDNNVLASNHGIKQIEEIIKRGIRVDFNQGLDARLIDNSMARLLSRVKWLSPVRLSCDSASLIKHVHSAVELLRWHNTTPRNYFCYVLVDDVDDALERVRFLKGIGVDPFAQPYRDEAGTPPTDKQRHFARWVNHKAVFKSTTWEEYSNG